MYGKTLFNKQIIMCKRIIFHNKLLNSQRYMCRQIPQSISVPYHIRPHLVGVYSLT